MNKNLIIFQDALACHQRGELAVATRKYRKLIKQIPDHIDALHHLGMIFKAEGQLDSAEDLFRRCLRLDPNFPPIYNSLGTLLSDKGDFHGAIACAEHALKLMPSNQNALILLGRSYNEIGEANAALAVYKRALFFNPNAYQVHNNAGNIYLARGEFDLALEAFDKAIQIEPSFELAYFNRASIFIRKSQLDAALNDLQRIVQLSPNNAIYWASLAELYGNLLRYNDALDAAQKASQLNPSSDDVIFALARAHLDLAHVEEAKRLFTQLIDKNLNNSLAWLGYGVVLKEMRDLEGAIEAFKRAKVGLSNEYDADFNLACIRLLQGNLLLGFEGFESRKKQSNPVGYRSYGVTEWSGSESLDGKTILIHEEQGIGDTIQFMRYLPLLSDLGAEIIFAVEPKLRRLLSGSPFKFTFVDPELPTVSFDYHCALMSLPHAFKTTLNTIPSDVPYLFPESARLEHWHGKLGKKDFKIGICWQGSRSKIDQGRSIPLSEFYRLARLKNVSLLSLQKGYGEEQLRDTPPDINILNLGDEYDSEQDAFIDAAAVIANCDLVISSDTAIAHLAGALGVKTWLALRDVPDWRWMLDRNDSPWYPSMRIFRQPIAGDWTSVFIQMENELCALLGEL